MYEPGTSSGAIGVTGGVQTVTGPGVLLLAQITAAAAVSTLIVYDGTSTSGLVLANISVVANTTQSSMPECGIAFNTGLFIVTTGAASSSLVVYRRN